MTAAHFVLTETAAAYLHEICDYIAADSIDAAGRVFGELLEACDRLGTQPGMGHAREDLVAKHPIKFRTVYNYLVIYRVDRVPIEVLGIVHGARDVETLMKDR